MWSSPMSACPISTGAPCIGRSNDAGPERAAHVVFVSGDTLASTLRVFAAESGCPVIEKPFLPSDVRRIVAEMDIDGERSVRH